MIKIQESCQEEQTSVRKFSRDLARKVEGEREFYLSLGDTHHERREYIYPVLEAERRGDPLFNYRESIRVLARKLEEMHPARKAQVMASLACTKIDFRVNGVYVNLPSLNSRAKSAPLLDIAHNPGKYF